MLIVSLLLLAVIVISRASPRGIVCGVVLSIIVCIKLIHVVVLHCSCACSTIDLLIVWLALIINLFLIVVFEAAWLVRVSWPAIIASNDGHLLLIVIVHFLL